MDSLSRTKKQWSDDQLLTIDERIVSNTRLASPTSLTGLQGKRVIKSQNMIESRYWNPEPLIDTRAADQVALAMVTATNRLQKASEQMPTSFYDYEQPYIAAKDREDVTDTDALRRAIHSISNYYNTLGVYRSDFDKNFNDLMSRTAIYAMCEKAMMDYMGSVPWSVMDNNQKPVEDAIEFMKYPNPQENFGAVLKSMIRDLMRYDAGVIVKSFSVGGRKGDNTKFSLAHPNKGYLLELKSYSGTEFWKEIDRVPMSINIPTAGNVPVQMTEPNSSHYTGWWSHGYTVRYWQRSRTGVYLPFQPEEVCYFMMYPVSDQIYGTDFIKYLRYHLQYLIDSTKAAGQTFANGVVPNMIWKHPQIRTVPQLTERIAQMQAELKGPMKFGGAMHLVGDETIESMNFSLHDMEWLEGQEYVAKLVWAMWGFSPTEFLGDSSNRATAYVGRNITKSRLLYPLMDLVEETINREILPYLQNYKKGWKFQFIKDIDLDDQQKIAHTTSIRAGSFSVYRNAGLKPSLAYKIGVQNRELSDAELEEMDETMSQMQGQGGIDDGTDQDQGRYGSGSEGYQPVSFSDYGQGGENTEQRMGESEETEHKNATVGKAMVLDTSNYEILSEDTDFIKARVYVKERSAVPRGRSAYPGSRGGFYYVTKIRKPKNRKPADQTQGGGSVDKKQKNESAPEPPDMPGGSRKYIQISGGTGVAVSAAEYSYGIEVRAAKNEATNKFIEWIKPKMKGIPDEDQIEELKKLAKQEGLMVKEGGES